jgi:hypothetical protein
MKTGRTSVSLATVPAKACPKNFPKLISKKRGQVHEENRSFSRSAGVARYQRLWCNCVGLPSESDLKSALIASAGNHAGGLFEGTRMWAAVVNRDGEICGYSIGFCASGLSEYLEKRRL